MIGLTFSTMTLRYSAHAERCTALCNTRVVIMLSERFDTVADAQDWANKDESDKAGRDVQARFKACKCTKVEA